MRLASVDLSTPETDRDCRGGWSVLSLAAASAQVYARSAPLLWIGGVSALERSTVFQPPASRPA